MNKRIEPSFERNRSRGQAAIRAPKRSNTAQTKKQRKAKAKSGNGFFRFLKFSTYWSFVLGIWGVIALAGFFAYHAIQLPSSSTWSIPKRPPNARIVSIDGSLIANRGVTGGQNTALDEMSPYLPMAVIAIEDRRFKYHFGVDPIGLARAMVTNVAKGRFVQGGSTLTQQLAKNLFLEPKRTLSRKAQEAILAFWLESKFSKDEIIELYLNRVYFGSGAYGVDAASRRYFGKSARDVNLAEAALLAGLLKAPSKLSPAKNPKGAEDRAQIVLTSMKRSGFITDREAATALTMQAKKAKRYWSGSEHYIADMVMKELPDLIGDLREDVVVDTTINFELQKLAGKIIAQTISKNEKKLKVTQGAMVSLDGTGAIRALVGGREYSDSQFNRAVDAKRQPGSAFKPMVYLAALEAGREPSSIRMDKPFIAGKWKPENYDKKFRGAVSLNQAMSSSLNTIAAQMVMEVGPRAVIEAAARLGIKSKLTRNASIALGTSEVSLMELTSAYAPFANGGYLAKPYVIKRIANKDGKVLYERKSFANPKVIASRELMMMNQMLRTTVEEGTGKAARVTNWQIGGKTGTTQNSRDALFVGYSANLITGFWFGNDNGSPTNKVTGGTIPAKSFATFMSAAHKNLPKAELPGYYLPQTIAMIPQPRPRLASDPIWRTPTLVRNNTRPVQRVRQQQVAVNSRRSLSTIENGDNGSLVPQTNVGGAKKPRSIIDIILGN
ncbi:MAG: transglycosylase domain-containing protein [Nitratireductor sp.]